MNLRIVRSVKKDGNNFVELFADEKKGDRIYNKYICLEGKDADKLRAICRDGNAEKG